MQHLRSSKLKRSDSNISGFNNLRETVISNRSEHTVKMLESLLLELNGSFTKAFVKLLWAIFLSEFFSLVGNAINNLLHLQSGIQNVDE